MDQRVKQLQEYIEAEITSQSYGNEPATLYEPIQYIMSLGGKRIRPLLAMLAYELFEEDSSRIVKQAVAVEVFHNFTLMHDDIMDRAPIRRGKPTVHEKWGDNNAILSGDVMLVKSYELFLESGAHNIIPILNAFNKCATEVCEGQQLDMDFEDRNDVSEEEYLNMIRLKTAVLLGFSARLGSMLASTSEENAQAMEDFAVNIGIGFQLMDDLLDVYGDAQKFGKQEGGDIIANKKTFLLIEALEKSNPEERKTLDYWIGLKDFDPAEKVREVKRIYDQIGVPEISKNKMNEYFNLGMQNLDQLSVEESRKDALKTFMTALMNRDR